MVNKVSRVIFTIMDEQIILLCGFIKKSRKLPVEDLHIARQRFNLLLKGRQK